MDTERLGIELGDLICETCGESIEEIDDIISTLGRMNLVFLEYIALLLWTATKVASNVLPEKSFQHASDIAFSVTFDFLNTIENLRDHPEFNMNKYEEFIHDRFEQYYGAWKDYPNPFDEDNEKVKRNFSVVLCFIRCCFADTAENLDFENKDYSVLVDKAWEVVGHHYFRFVERIRSVLSRF